MKTLKINEIFSSVQGEGVNAGKTAIFLRLAGCNRKCDFCDTSHQEISELDVFLLAQTLSDIYQGEQLIVITGGEPTLQNEGLFILTDIINEFLPRAEIELETNGSNEVLKGYDYISLSPKQSLSETVVKECTSLKLIYPLQTSESLLDWQDHIKADRYYLQIKTPPGFRDGGGIEGGMRVNLFDAARKLKSCKGNKFQITFQNHRLWRMK